MLSIRFGATVGALALLFGAATAGCVGSGEGSGSATTWNAQEVWSFITQF